MEQIVLEDDKFKRKMRIICYLPAFAFLIPVIYYGLLLMPLLHGHPEPKSAVGITSLHYNAMFFLLAIASTVSAVVLLCCVIHLVRIRTLNTPQKMIWMLLLLAVPISFIIFWHRQINHEPRNMPVNPEID